MAITSDDAVSEPLPEFSYSKLMDKGNITQDWILFNSPFPVATILLVYLLVVLKLGPQFMRTRTPYELTTVLRVYNVFQVFLNVYFLQGFVYYPAALPTVLKKSCSIKEDDNFDYLKQAFLVYSWVFLVLKLTDLLDTIFMILRKKDSHISFLHIYHHVGMVICVWFSNTYIKSHHGVVPALINATVHTIMYSYYFLATFPHLKKHLWWKKHLTKLQLGQFLVILIYLSLLYYNGCPMSRVFTYIWVFNVFIIMLLFINFYIKTYVVTSSTVSDHKGHAKRL